MFTVDFKINDKIVSSLAGVNVEDIDGDTNHCIYEWSYIDCETGQRQSGRHVHFRSNGLKRLARDILRNVKG